MGDDGTDLIFDEVAMQDMIDMWAEQYAEGVKVVGWYYDCRQAVIVIRGTVPRTCDDCDTELHEVRPGKWQCPVCG